MPGLVLRIFGKASNKEVKAFYFQKDEQALQLDLLSFLRQEKFPIASSCYGEGVCQKCRYNGDQLACQVKIGDFFVDHEEKIINIDYL